MKLRIHNCIVLRRHLVSFGYMDGLGGPFVKQGEEWRTEPCNTPLFSDAERETGVCRSCMSGWTHPNNYPVSDKYRRDVAQAEEGK